MLDLLARRQASRLQRLLAARPLLAFDFDGTLAPIAPTPDEVLFPSTTRALLSRVARELPCAVISGRGRDDLLRHLGRLPLALVVGSYGAEWPQEPVPTSWSNAVRDWTLELEARVGTLPGVVLEPKPATLSVHFRHSPDRVRARRAIEAEARRLPARVEPGLLVVNLFPKQAPDKGAALRRAMVRLGCDHALFFGDDQGDEAAFCARSGVVGVLVGPARPSRAGFRLTSQDRMDELLTRVLATTRRRPRHAPPRRSGG